MSGHLQRSSPLRGYVPVLVLAMILYTLLYPNPILVCCFLLVVSQYFVRVVVGPRIIRSCLKHADAEKTIYFVDKFIYHTLGFILAIAACNGTILCWIETCFDITVDCGARQQEIDFAYQYQIAYYAGSLIHMTLFDTHSSEFRIMLIHHCAAFILICYSYCTPLSHAGIVIMAIHNGTDIFLYGAKLCRKNCLNLPIIEKILFIALIITFFGARLVFLPYQTMQHVLVVGYQLNIEPYLCGLLFILTILQVRWGMLMIRAAFTLAKDGNIEDPRDIKNCSSKECYQKLKQIIEIARIPEKNHTE